MAVDRKRLDKLLRTASSVLGCSLEPVQVVGERRMIAKLSSLLENDSHSMHDTLTARESSFWDRLFHPKWVKEASLLSDCTNQHCSQETAHTKTDCKPCNFNIKTCYFNITVCSIFVQLVYIFFNCWVVASCLYYSFCFFYLAHTLLLYVVFHYLSQVFALLLMLLYFWYPFADITM